MIEVKTKTLNADNNSCSFFHWSFCGLYSISVSSSIHHGWQQRRWFESVTSLIDSGRNRTTTVAVARIPVTSTTTVPQLHLASSSSSFSSTFQVEQISSRGRSLADARSHRTETQSKIRWDSPRFAGQIKSGWARSHVAAIDSTWNNQHIKTESNTPERANSIQAVHFRWLEPPSIRSVRNTIRLTNSRIYLRIKQISRIIF